MKDILNNRYGRLYTTEYLGKDKNYNCIWKCICDCGNIATATYTQLNSGKKKSCGCLSDESRRKIKGNTYEDNETYVIGYATNTNSKFYFDKEDFSIVSKYSWYENSDGYMHNKTSESLFLHRLILGLESNDNKEGDHINHNIKDNRKINLRVVNRTQNNMNHYERIDNTSGRKGVDFNKNRWRARISYNGKTVTIGRFKTFEEAVEARINAEIEHFGEYNADIYK